MVHNVQDGQGIQALDHENLLSWIRGDTIVSGCAPSAGSGSLEVDVASGTARVNGSNVAVSSGTATLTAGGSNPRKDVVYIDSGGNIQVAEGSAESAAPSGKSRFATYQPSPSDLSSTDAAVVAEVWVASGQSGTFASADIRDRRVFSTVDLDSVTVGTIDGNGSAISVGDAMTPDVASTHDLGSSSNPWAALFIEDVNGADISAAAEGHALTKAASGSDLEFEQTASDWWTLIEWGWVAESIFATTTGSGSVSFLRSSILLRQSGAGASEEASRIFNNGVGFDPSVSGSVDLSVSNVTVDNDSNARIVMAITDSPNTREINAGDDLIALEIQGGGTVRARVEDDGTDTTTSDTSQNNAYVNSLSSIKLSWDGSTGTAEVDDGSTTVTVNAGTNYPSGENLFLKIEVIDSSAAAGLNVDFDIDDFTLT